MPLSDLQTALGMMVTTRAATNRSAGPLNFDNLRLTEQEREWLTSLMDKPGFNVTCRIQRWWRETKLSWTTSLTMAALGSQRADAALRAYLETTPCSSLFFTPEALSFLEFIAGSQQYAPNVIDVARFERALLIAKEAAQQSAARCFCVSDLPSGAKLSPHPSAALLEFSAPPEDLLGALVERRPLPPASPTRFPVLVAPGLPYFWTPASADESLLFTRCQNGASIEDIRGLIPNHESILFHLLNVGALQAVLLTNTACEK